MLSTILYSEEAVMAIMAGRAYCQSNLPMGFVPSSSVACLLSIKIFLFIYVCKGSKNMWISERIGKINQ
jgi:hypothetical protein